MRNTLIDNAKGGLIFLVVLGHYLEAANGWSNQYLSAVLSIIYVFHMPAFVFLAGITTKRDRLGMRIANIAIMLVIFQLAYLVPLTIMNGAPPVRLFQPYWILWFLLSLMWWMMLTPLIVRLPGALVISIIIAIAGGLFPGDGYQFSIMRTLTFLPFFVAGQLYGGRIIAELDACATRRFLAVAVLGASAVIAYFIIYVHGLGPRWLYGSFSYARLGFDDATGAMVRAALLILSSVSLIAFLVCVTRKHSLLTVIGQNSLSIYVLHGFAVIIADKLLGRTGLPTSPWILALAVIAALVTTIILAHPVFDTTIRRFAGRISGYTLKIRLRCRTTLKAIRK